MDIPRESSKRRRLLRRGVFAVIVSVSVLGATVGVSRLEPAAPTVDRSIVWKDTVKRGDMVRKVRAMGNLVPVDIRWISPDTQGRVEKILVQPGAHVTRETVILELSNPELELAAEEAKLKVRSAECQYDAKKVEIEHELLNLQTSAARVEADYIEAKLRAQSDEELAKEGVIAELQLQISKVRAEELAKLKEIENKRVKVQEEHAETQLEVLQAQIDQAQALHNLKRKQLEWLRVRPGIEGVLEQLLVEEGQQVTIATSLAKVSDPTRLKAVLRVDQNHAREVRIGQRAEIDLRNNTDLRGHVARIDPAVQEGTVNVDVVLDDPLPEGARPDLSLDGEIEIEKLTHILYVGRPVFGQADSTITMFKLEPDQREANRVTVALGRGSVNLIEVVNGLREGDAVILSDMSEWDDVDRIRLR